MNSGESSKTKKLAESRQRKLNLRTISNLLLWILVSIAISVLFIFLEDVTDTGEYGYGSLRSGGWAKEASITVTIILFNLLSADILRHYIKQHGRNMIAWTTAVIVFSPILASIVYLLTWPKDKKLTGLE